MVNKLYGFVVAGLGIVGLAFASIPQFKAMIPIPASIAGFISSKNVIVGGLILVVLGLGMAFQGSGKKKQKFEEVPIYEGEKIVGYRKEKK
jgi:hypothetical protein